MIIVYVAGFAVAFTAAACMGSERRSVRLACSLFVGLFWPVIVVALVVVLLLGLVRRTPAGSRP